VSAIRPGIVLLLGLLGASGCGLLGSDPTPLSSGQMPVGTERWTFIVAMTEGESAEEPAFKAKVSEIEAKGGGPVVVTWLGCQPEQADLMAKHAPDGRRWVATISHRSHSAQEAWLRKYRVQPLAGVLETVEACGD